MKLSPNSYIRLKNITWYKNVKQVFQTLCLDLIPLSVVEEHCISEETLTEWQDGRLADYEVDGQGW